MPDLVSLGVAKRVTGQVCTSRNHESLPTLLKSCGKARVTAYCYRSKICLLDLRPSAMRRILERSCASILQYRFPDPNKTATTSQGESSRDARAHVFYLDTTLLPSICANIEGPS